MIHTVVSMAEVTKFAWCKMKKLCIHIYTSYSDYTKNEQNLLWDKEVNQDALTVRTVFKNDTIVDIPVIAGASKQKKLNSDAVLSPLYEVKLADYDECHIVLNTHGAAGVNDLSDEVVKAVVSAVSIHEINITQISALQCNGLKGLTAIENKQKDLMAPEHKEVGSKSASMAILQGKLNHLKTKIEQTFSIHGFMSAYDPATESDKVERLLLRGSAKSLSVKTVQAKEENIQTVNECIDICRTATNKGSLEYINATNELAKLLHKMKQNISLYLQGREDLDDRNKILLQKVLGDSNVEGDATNVDFQREYKRWLRTHKITSTERLDVFQGYCAAIQVNVEPEKTRTQLSISTLCYGNIGYFTKIVSEKDTVVIPEVDRSCTF